MRAQERGRPWPQRRERGGQPGQHHSPTPRVPFTPPAPCPPQPTAGGRSSMPGWCGIWQGVDRGRTPWVIVVMHAPWYNSNYAHQVPAARLPCIVWCGVAAHGAACRCEALGPARRAARARWLAPRAASGAAATAAPPGYRPCLVQGEGEPMREAMEALLYEHGVDFVFAGAGGRLGGQGLSCLGCGRAAAGGGACLLHPAWAPTPPRRPRRPRACV